MAKKKSDEIKKIPEKKLKPKREIKNDPKNKLMKKKNILFMNQ